MDRVRALPHIVRRERENADDAAGPVVERAVLEERAMAAIVLDQEQAHEERGGGDGEDEREPAIAELPCRPDHQPQRHEGHGGHDQFECAAHDAGIAVAAENADPVRRGGWFAGFNFGQGKRPLRRVQNPAPPLQQFAAKREAMRVDVMNMTAAILRHGPKHPGFSKTEHRLGLRPENIGGGNGQGTRGFFG